VAQLVNDVADSERAEKEKEEKTQETPLNWDCTCIHHSVFPNCTLLASGRWSITDPQSFCNDIDFLPSALAFNSFYIPATWIVSYQLWRFTRLPGGGGLQETSTEPWSTSLFDSRCQILVAHHSSVQGAWSAWWSYLMRASPS
jgi:hypothetical protein